MSESRSSRNASVFIAVATLIIFLVVMTIRCGGICRADQALPKLNFELPVVVEKYENDKMVMRRTIIGKQDIVSFEAIDELLSGGYSIWTAKPWPSKTTYYRISQIFADKDELVVDIFPGGFCESRQGSAVRRLRGSRLFEVFELLFRDHS